MERAMEHEPKLTPVELAGELALIEYLGLDVYLATLHYICSKAD